MQTVRAFYVDRVEEIDSFLKLIETVQVASRDGAPRIGGAGEITTDHQKILVSTAYIQLYSLLESTVGQSLAHIAEQVSHHCSFQDLNDNLRREWTDFQLKNYAEGVTQEKRSDLALRMSNHVVGNEPLFGFKIEKRNAKGWDRKIVDTVIKRIGVTVAIPIELDRDLNVHYSNDMAPLTFLKVRRGQLAHGDISFVQSGEVTSIDDLKRLRDVTCAYLDAVLNSLQTFLDTQAYRRVETNDDPRNAATEPTYVDPTG